MPANPGSVVEWLGVTNVLTFALALVVFYLCIQLMVLAHELGHAVAGLIACDGPVAIRVGRVPATWRWQLGRLLVELSLLPQQRGRKAGVAVFHTRFGRMAGFAVYLAGPLAGGIFGLLVLEGGRRAHLNWLLGIGAWCIFFNALHLLPLSPRIDGVRAVKALSRPRVSGPPPPTGFDATLRRWLPLVADAHRGLEGHDPNLLRRALVGLGRAPTDASEAGRAIIRLAFAGWCWRQAERELPGGVHPSEAAASLEVGFGHALVPAPTPLPPRDARRAFAYGIALYDIATGRVRAQPAAIDSAAARPRTSAWASPLA